jgi:tight adherence protein B
MRLVAALCAGAFVYSAVGFATGHAPRLHRAEPNGRRSRRSRAEVWLAQAGVWVSFRQFVLASLGVAAASFALVLLVTGSIGVAVVPAILMGSLPRAYYGRRRAVRVREVQTAWPDGIHELIGSIASGRSLPQSISDLAHRGPPPLRRAFARFPSLLNAVGTAPALEAVREELADPVSDRVIEVLILANEEGGHTVMEILRDLAQATSRDQKALEEIKSNQLEQRINAWAVSALPWMVLLFLTMSPGHFRDFYRSGAGLFVIAIGGVLTLLGLWWLNRLGREPIEDRVFGGAETAEVPPEAAP